MLMVSEDMYFWQISIVILCKKLNVYPFDEPDVKSSKLNTLRILKEGEKNIKIGSQFSSSQFSKLLDLNKEKDLLYINLYIQEKKELKNNVENLKLLIQKNLNIDLITGFGPRYLHSVGQLQKGGPKNIWVLFLYDENIEKIRTNNDGISELKDIYCSQLLGDLMALKSKNINTYLININSKKSNPFDNIMEEIKELS